MEIRFLHISPPLPKEGFLQHIHRLVHINLDEGDTYLKLFDKLKDRFDEDSDEGKAVTEWIDFNQQDVDDDDQWETVIADEEGLCAHFDIIAK